ncbi:MAG: FHA domain-containing protein [Gammaproteobacteria bacterium]|nr:FHA domain-containing protein [Gammaproteobacteria bacterium]MDH5650719.1 FHA domain-containing protein [Gammaproteobacteria bacterium]
MELVIELVGRGNRHFDFMKISGERITLGRSFDNDVVLADPYICPTHAVLEEDENGTIILRDLGSVNGTFCKNQQSIAERQAVNSGDEFRLGKTRIRIYRKGHAAEPSIRLNRIEKALNFIGKPVVTGALALTAVLLLLFQAHALELYEIKFARLLSEPIKFSISVFAWAFVWSMYARLKKHEMHFLSQLAVTIIYGLLVELFEISGSWLAYNTGAVSGIDTFSGVIIIPLSFGLIWINYYLSGYQTPKKRLAYTAGLITLIFGFAYLLSTPDADRFRSRPQYFTVIYPPGISIYSAGSNTEYMQDAEAVFDKAKKKVKD